MISDLGLEGDQSVEYGVSQAQDMASIISRLITDGKLNSLKFSLTVPNKKNQIIDLKPYLYHSFDYSILS